MKKYVNYNDFSVKTEDELKEIWRANQDSDSYATETFEQWLNACIDKGTLDIVANDYDIENRRRWTATKIAAQSDMKYGDILNVLQKYNIHGNWTPWEINNRPVDYDELQEIVEQELRR